MIPNAKSSAENDTLRQLVIIIKSYLVFEVLEIDMDFSKKGKVLVSQIREGSCISNQVPCRSEL